MLEIRILGDPVLRCRAEEIKKIDDDVRKLATAMLDAMYGVEGIGLAAPQVGISERLFVMDTQQPDSEVRAVVNPVIVERTGEERAEEGCLSIPGLNAHVDRAETIVMEGLDLDGNPIVVEAAGLDARVIQHEIDHLDGILFIDRVSPIKRRILLSKWKKMQKEAARP